MEKINYVFGHKNPDTDSVVSAYGLAYLKNLFRKEGEPVYIAARAGKLSPQTDFVFKNAGVTPPVYIADLTPKVCYYMSEDFLTIDESQSVQAASFLMQKYNYHFLSVTDENKRYKSLLNYAAFAKNLINSLNPEHHIKVFTNHHLIRQSLGAIFASDGGISANEPFTECTIIVAAADLASFKKTVDERPEQKLIVIAGDRDDIIDYAVEKKAYCIIISGGRTVSPELNEKARRRGVCILISSFDTASTSMLATYATPVSSIADSEVAAVHENDSVLKVRAALKKSHDHILPVVNEDNVVTGIITESLLNREPKISVSLVDHNEPGQAVDGIENYRISEIIDHHRIDTLTTKYPVTFINMSVGSTATIITRLFDEAKIKPEPSLARLLLAGILSDTLVLQSSTVTVYDKTAAVKLAEIAGVSVEEYGTELMKAGIRSAESNAHDLIVQDLKEYKESGISFTLSQIEVYDLDSFLQKKDQLLEQLEIERSSRQTAFSALMITDIANLNSYLLCNLDKVPQLLNNFPVFDQNVYFLKGIVSRKKQLVPILSEMIGTV